MDSFRVMQIDHVELFVPDRHEAADWYRRVLGLQVVPGYEQWAANPGGPLMIATAAGGTKLALFEGQPQESRPTAGFHRVAFRVDGAGFLAFVRRLGDHPVRDHQGRPVTADAVVDHDVAHSIYFCDPYGHHLEVTTYEHDAVRAGVG
jgi:catechol 2,3-dioxygenase-like lactoylglutathione lyase family enzyme